MLGKHWGPICGGYYSQTLGKSVYTHPHTKKELLDVNVISEKLQFYKKNYPYYKIASHATYNNYSYALKSTFFTSFLNLELNFFWK